MKKIWYNNYCILEGYIHGIIQDNNEFIVDLTSTRSNIRRTWYLKDIVIT